MEATYCLDRLRSKYLILEVLAFACDIVTSLDLVPFVNRCLRRLLVKNWSLVKRLVPRLREISVALREVPPIGMLPRGVYSVAVELQENTLAPLLKVAHLIP